MEGFLFEKRENVSSGFMASGKTYKRRWIEVQDQELTIFDDAVVITPQM